MLFLNFRQFFISTSILMNLSSQINDMKQLLEVSYKSRTTIWISIFFTPCTHRSLIYIIIYLSSRTLIKSQCISFVLTSPLHHSLYFENRHCAISAVSLTYPHIHLHTLTYIHLHTLTYIHLHTLTYSFIPSHSFNTVTLSHLSIWPVVAQ